MSNVSQDRSCVRENIKQILESEECRQDFMKNNSVPNRFSYVETFLNYTKISKEGTRRKIGTLSTINLLFSIESSLKKLDIRFIKSINKIKSELSNREDLFDAVLDFYESKNEGDDEVDAWHPDLKYCDVLSLVLDLMPDIVSEYKKYLARCFIVNCLSKKRFLQVLKTKVQTNLAYFDVMHKDLVLFKIAKAENVFGVENSKQNIKRKRVQKEGFVGYKIVSGLYWTNDDTEIDECACVLNLIEPCEKHIKYSSDMNLTLVPALSYVDITIGQKRMVVDMVKLNDLMTQNNRSKEFWVRSGIVREDWNYL